MSGRGVEYLLNKPICLHNSIKRLEPKIDNILNQLVTINNYLNKFVILKPLLTI